MRKSLSRPYICPKCGQDYSIKEQSESKFCRKCDTRLIVWTDAGGLLAHPIEKMPKSKKSFIKQIYSNVAVVKNSPLTECDRCFAKYRFSTLDDFPHKPCFPPIGSSDLAQVLFIGTNPRCDKRKDEDFYRHALSSRENFLQFSNDGMYKDSDEEPRSLFHDPHYFLHAQCLWKVNPSWKLGQKSSVAELFMCCSESSNIFSGVHEYICAEEYLIKYMELVRPKIIVSFGSHVLKWFQNRFANDLKGNVQYLDITGPRDYVGDPRMDTTTRLHTCFSKIRLDSRHPSEVIFSFHPKMMKDEDKEKLLRTFLFLAKNSGF